MLSKRQRMCLAHRTRKGKRRACSRGGWGSYDAPRVLPLDHWRVLHAIEYCGCCARMLEIARARGDEAMHLTSRWGHITLCAPMKKEDWMRLDREAEQ